MKIEKIKTTISKIETRIEDNKRNMGVTTCKKEHLSLITQVIKYKQNLRLLSKILTDGKKDPESLNNLSLTEIRFLNNL